MKRSLIPVLLIVLISGCTTTPETKTDVVALTQHTLGTYEASLPCEGCISIEYQLELESDSTFIEHISFLGNPDGVYEVHGTWKADADSLLTLSTGRLAHKIKVNSDGTLIIADAIENHLEKQPAILTRMGTTLGTDQSTLLNDIWVLEAIDQVEITEAEYPKERPRLEFHKVDGTVMGTTGCNTLTGTYTSSGNALTFGPLITTKMACPGQGESQFVKALAEVSAFKIINLKLYLLSGNAEKLRLKKVD